MEENKWLCSSMTSVKYGFDPFWTTLKKECEICGFNNIVRIHHIISLSERGDHCEENVVILCPNHHDMIHHSKFKDKIKLFKPGKEREFPKEELEYKKEIEDALLEESQIIYNNMFNGFIDEKEKVKAFKRLASLSKKYTLDYLDFIGYLVGISKDYLVKEYIFNGKL